MPKPPDPEHTIHGYLAADHDRLDAMLLEVTELVAGAHFAQAKPVMESFDAGLRRHIRLEDELLFPTFERVTGMTSGPTRVMREEHRAIEHHLGALVDAVELGDRAAFTSEKSAMVAILGDHNAKEEAIIYPMTDQHLQAPERTKLVALLRGFR